MDDNDFIDIDILPATSEEAAYKRTNDRIDELISSMEHGGGGQAEVIDIRTGYNDTVYPTAGESVRTQVENIHKIFNSKIYTDTENDNFVIIENGIKRILNFNDDNSVTWEYYELTNLSYLNNYTIPYNTYVEIHAKAGGGTPPYLYQIETKSSTDNDYYAIQTYNEQTTKNWKPKRSGDYEVKVTVKDSVENTAEKILLLTVTPTEGVEESDEAFVDDDTEII